MPPTSGAGPIPVVRVVVGTSPADRRDFAFQQPFRIGRAGECEVSIPRKIVSRNHASVTFANGRWWVVDNGSVNGLFVDGLRVTRAPVAPTLTLRLGAEGPYVWFQVEEPAPEPALPEPPALALLDPQPTERAPEPARPTPQPREAARTPDVVAKYFGKSVEGEKVGEHTMFVRQAFRQIQKKQKRRYGGIIAALVVVALGIAGFAYYQYEQARQQKVAAQDIFYAMKSLDVDIAGLEKLVLDRGGGQGAEQIKRYRERREDMERNYDRFLSTLQVYDPRMKEPERLLLRVARVFGECELAMPPGFAAEVESYIKRWQSSGRYARAVRTALEKGYTRAITEELLAQGLPPQFFYLAMQESDFDAFISGPPTRKGIAKGMWQFIPETGAKYGLRIGPLADLRRPDPGDDRHDWQKATRAAARYLKDLYVTDAQASGLLVMASYNWGEERVIPLIRSLPPNPRERNYWRLLASYKDKVPQETYDYVFYIVSAAVIGENPRLFGFDFDNPLGHLDQK
jgi:membrane-bound lytic murein transglycosylase D